MSTNQVHVFAADSHGCQMHVLPVQLNLNGVDYSNGGDGAGGVVGGYIVRVKRTPNPSFA